MIGLGAALDYVSGLGIEKIGAYEHELLDTPRRPSRDSGLKIIGTAKKKPACFRSLSKIFTRTISERSSTGKESRFAPGTTARSR